MRDTARFLLLLFLFAGASMQNCRAELTELQVESAYVFNFIKFAEWPTDTLKSGDKIRLCILGNDELHASLSTLNGRKAGAYVLQVMPRSDDYGNFSVCHALYIDDQEQRRLVPILKALQTTPVLTISDIPNFAERGGNIGLLYRDNKVLFEVNLAATRKVGLQLSSQMLNLAANIFGR
jgi:hypothetical protein